MFSRNIGCFLGGCHQSVHGSDIDDPSPILSLHGRKTHPDAMKRGGEIDGNHLFPLLYGELLHQSRVLDAGIIDEHIDFAEVLESFIDKMLYFRDAGHIRRHMDCFFCSGGLQVGEHLLYFSLRTKTIDGNIQMLLSQGQGHRPADTTGSASHHRRSG